MRIIDARAESHLVPDRIHVEPGVHTLANQAMAGLLEYAVEGLTRSDMEDPRSRHILSQVEIFTTVLRKYNEGVIMRSPWDRAQGAIRYAAEGYAQTRNDLAMLPFSGDSMQRDRLECEQAAYRDSLLVFRQGSLVDEINESITADALTTSQRQ